MKAIIKAMQETEFKPRAKWWGFVKDNKRYLMRYHHTIMVVDEKTNEILYTFWETRTDKAGLSFAIRHLYKDTPLHRVLSVDTHYIVSTNKHGYFIEYTQSEDKVKTLYEKLKTTDTTFNGYFKTRNIEELTIVEKTKKVFDKVLNKHRFADLKMMNQNEWKRA